jgi:quinolinate synthase
MNGSSIMPDYYRGLSSLELKEKILAHKENLGDELVILAHHYQRQEVVDVADLLGDSLKLSRAACEQKARYIVFCGVHFMAESAAILARHDQAVFIPDPRAGCPLADLSEIHDVERAWQEINQAVEGEKVIPITYINSDCQLKAFCGDNDGAICTSGNASRVMEWGFEQGDKVLFFPDENLGRNSGNKLGIKDMAVWDPGLPQGGLQNDMIRNSRLILWRGYCHVHTFFTREQLERRWQEYPGAMAVVHPECVSEVARVAGATGSTEGILDFARKAPPGSTIIVGTEIHMVERLARDYAGNKKVVPLERSVCPNMYKINLQNLLWILDGIARGKDHWVNQVIVPERIRDSALVALRRMLEMG